MTVVRAASVLALAGAMLIVFGFAVALTFVHVTLGILACLATLLLLFFGAWFDPTEARMGRLWEADNGEEDTVVLHENEYGYWFTIGKQRVPVDEDELWNLAHAIFQNVDRPTAGITAKQPSDDGGISAHDPNRCA